MKTKFNCTLPAALAFIVLLLSFSTRASAQSDALMPEWMSVDHDAKTVSVEMIAGKTDAFNYWNFNGLTGGEASVVVPLGYTITLTFINNDPMMRHSIGIGLVEDAFPAMFAEAVPVFEGAMSSNPLDMMLATRPGETEVLTFVVSEAGDFALICYIPGHASMGMWLGFSVSKIEDDIVGLVTR